MKDQYEPSFITSRSEHEEPIPIYTPAHWRRVLACLSDALMHKHDYHTLLLNP